MGGENRFCPRVQPHGVAQQRRTPRRPHDVERSSGEMKTRLVPSFARGAMNRALCAFCAETRLLRDFPSREESISVTFPFMGESGRPSRFFLSFYGWLSSPHLAQALTQGFHPVYGLISLARSSRLYTFLQFIRCARVALSLPAFWRRRALRLRYLFRTLTRTWLSPLSLPPLSFTRELPPLLSGPPVLPPSGVRLNTYATKPSQR